MDEEFPIEVVPKSDVAPPRLGGTVVVRPDADSLIDVLLAELAIHSRNCVRAFGDFHLAISGTADVEPYLRRLMYDPGHRDFPWLRTRVWMVDEVREPATHARSRYTRVKDLLLEQSGIPPDQFHGIDAGVERGSDGYEAELRERLGWREKGHDRLDFVLVTLEEGGGVAGYTGRSSPLVGEGRLVQEIGGADGGEAFTSMTLEFINASRVVAVIAGGVERRELLRRVSAAHRAGVGPTNSGMPVLGLAPLAGELRWYVDHAACQARSAVVPGRNSGYGQGGDRRAGED